MTDYLQRHQDLGNLITIIESLSHLSNGATFALNGQWGSGKTFLLNELEEAFSSKSDSPYFIVRYDCWKNNYYSEPIIPMLSAIIELLNYKSVNIENGILDSIKDSASKYIGIMLKNTIGFNPIEIVTNVNEHIEKLQIADFAFDNIAALKEALNKVRASLKELAEKKTIIFIVDELDRCLPTYSIRVLENIHHIFSDINNFITILAIDQNELTQVIKTAYGAAIDVSSYLKKIIDFYVPLDLGNPDPNYMDKYSDFSDKFIGTEEARKWSREVIPKLMVNIDIRTQEKIWKKAELIHNMITQEQLDYSCLIYELIVLIEDFYNFICNTSSDSNATTLYKIFQDTLTALLAPSSKSSTSTILNGREYPLLSDHISAKIIWYREGQTISENSSLSSGIDNVRLNHACPYVDSIKKDDELMHKFIHLAHIIQ